MITAPYNFVPQNSKVFCPFWHEDVNHDIPFENGQSGVLHLKITAKSPIFIKNSKESNLFCNYNDKFYIPSTSLKGMFRNVLEIMSFGKINFIDDEKYSVRDIQNTQYMEKAKNAKCGWLYKKGERYEIESCGVPYRISHKDLDKKFKINFVSKFSNTEFENSNDDMKTAGYKYRLLQTECHEKIYKFSSIKNTNKVDTRKVVEFDDNGNIEGKIVFTGQASPRIDKGGNQKASGKHLEFVFESNKNAKILQLGNGVFENFKFAYFDGKTTQPKESEDWKFWKEKLKDGKKIPVFFHDNGKEITSFGLSYLYKFLYEKSIKDGLGIEHLQSEKLDLAELIFGYSKKINQNQQSLKGRVFISHAKLINTATTNKETEIVLGSPKPSYYPNYLVQTIDSNKYNTFMSENMKLSGWKRYPIHKNFKGQDKSEVESELKTKITPLNEGSAFECKIVVHNLIPVELGALISAITFHNNKDCFHNIGMGKPLGYGKIKVEIGGFDGFDKSQDEYMKIFESAINHEIFNKEKEKWNESEQIVSLFTMAQEQENKEESELKYMELEQFSKNKSLVDKKVANFLKPYISLFNKDKIAKINKLSDEKSIQEYANFAEYYKEKQENEAKELQENQKIEKLREDTKDLNEIQKIIYELKLQPIYKTVPESTILFKAIFELNKFKEQQKELEVLKSLKQMLIESKKWKEISNAKKPEKDIDYQNTIKIINRIKELEDIISEQNR